MGALMDYCTANNKKFLWAFGGWSDLKRTIADDQVDSLVDMLVELLEKVGGDGIDFDWEHLSEYKDIDNAVHAQQRLIVGKVIVALKDALVARGMADKLITYTPRYNAFLQGGAYNSNEFRTDGEGIDIVEYVVANSAHGVDAIDFVHYMMYDINAQEGWKNAPEEYFVEEHYDAVIKSSLERHGRRNPLTDPHGMHTCAVPNFAAQPHADLVFLGNLERGSEHLTVSYNPKRKKTKTGTCPISGRPINLTDICITIISPRSTNMSL